MNVKTGLTIAVVGYFAVFGTLYASHYYYSNDTLRYGTTLNGSKFNQQVERWSKELDRVMDSIQVTPTDSGNCLPVAIGLIKLIEHTGRKAVIAYVHKEGDTAGHAMVLFDSNRDGKLDSIIDNGSYTYHAVLPRVLLDDGFFGEYRGTCDDPDGTNGTCGSIGAAK